MKATDFNERVLDGLTAIKERMPELEAMAETKMQCKNVFNYAAWCEHNFERNLADRYERQTTFTSDFSIAEWCESVEQGAVLDTFKRAVTGWKDNITYFAELVIVLNMKCLEHHARNNHGWVELYSDLYYFAKDLYFDWFDEENEKHDEAINYYYDYVD